MCVFYSNQTFTYSNDNEYDVSIDNNISNNTVIKNDINDIKSTIKDINKKIHSKLTPWHRVQIARHPGRPHTIDYINRICKDYIELHGDRRYADDVAMVGGFATIDDHKVMIIGTQKGHDVKDNIYRRFGCPQPEGYRKALRLMKLAHKAGLPIISMIDTPGAYPGISSEERHIGEAIAVNLMEMFDINVPIISVIIGEGGSGGALGIGVSNKIIMLEHAYYSVITPEGCSAILWPNMDFAPKAAELLKLTSEDLFEFGIIDQIIEEPIGGAHNDYDNISISVRNILINLLNYYKYRCVDDILKERYIKYRNIGKYIS